MKRKDKYETIDTVERENTLLSFEKNILNIIKIKLASRNLIHMSDEEYLRRLYKKQMKEELNIESPQTFNEKLQWLKLYNRNPSYTKMVDKYEVRNYIEEKIGAKYLIPLIGVYEKFNEINFNNLPKQFVIKCTHDSGGNVICKDKNQLNIRKARRKIQNAMKRNYYYGNREWPYKDIKPKIIIEQYMEDESRTELKDYKFFCFNGKVKIVLVCSNRFKKLKKTFFDDKWNELNLTEGVHEKDQNLKKPINFEKMKELAEILSEEIPFVRVDFYEIDQMIYFGEITFFPQAGYEKFNPEEYDRIWGAWINLPIQKK